MKYDLVVEEVVNHWKDLDLYGDKTTFDDFLNYESQDAYGTGNYKTTIDFNNAKDGSNKVIYLDQCLDQLRYILRELLFPQCNKQCETHLTICINQCMELQNVCGKEFFFKFIMLQIYIVDCLY